MFKRQRGFSLIELMVVIVITGILFAVGLPSYRVWTQNTKIRTTAESIRNGLQLARSEAVRRNAPVQFQFNAGGTSGGWRVCAENVNTTVFTNCLNPIQAKPATEGGAEIKVYSSNAVGTLTTPLTTSGVTAAPNATFTGLGRLQQPAVDLARVDVRLPDLGTDERNLVIVLSAGGTIRTCDPKFNVSSDPRGC